MDDRLFAKNLRKPEGEVGKAIGKIMNEMNAFITRFTYRLMDIKSNENILEIGTGNGKFIREIYEYNENIHYMGIDLSNAMIEEARKQNKDLIDQGKVDFLLGNSKELPLESDYANKVCLINTIYFWEDPLQDLKEIYRVLKNDGKIYISIRSKDKLENERFTRFYFRLYKYDEIKEYLKQAGFKNIRLEHKPEPGKEDHLDAVCIIAEKQL